VTVAKVGKLVPGHQGSTPTRGLLLLPLCFWLLHDAAPFLEGVSLAQPRVRTKAARGVPRGWRHTVVIRLKRKT
jgi:hypothetical protein